MSEWQKIVIENVTADQAIRMKNELLEDGLVLNVDFNFFYRKLQLSSSSRSVVFEFLEPGYSAFYKMKWE